MIDNGSGRKARVQAGDKQYLVFPRDRRAGSSPTTSHHVQIYIADFSGPYRRLGELGLDLRWKRPWEYRFKDIVDLDTREVLFTVEHEVRSQTHPMYGAAAGEPESGADQSRLQAGGHDSMSWAMS